MVKYIPYKQLFIYYKSRKNEGVHMEINLDSRKRDEDTTSRIAANP